MDWNKIDIKGISRIDKCVAEFDVWAIPTVPYAKFKVKVFQDLNGKYTGYTNLRVKSDFDGSPEGGIGYGNSIDEALENTLQYFMELVKQKGEELGEEDIEYSESSDF
ncbi:MAG TPA: hypothetical protein PK566_18885 [Pseudobacteroides sp.]|nr:hypothetical protein [Pseudobacteroides sp.]